jgi:hypothetical protein
VAKKAALPPAAVPETIATAGAKGAAAAIIITAGRFRNTPMRTEQSVRWSGLHLKRLRAAKCYVSFSHR